MPPKKKKVQIDVSSMSTPTKGLRPGISPVAGGTRSARKKKKKVVTPKKDSPAPLAKKSLVEDVIASPVMKTSNTPKSSSKKAKRAFPESPLPSNTNEKEDKVENDTNDDKKMGSPMVVAGGYGNASAMTKSSNTPKSSSKKAKRASPKSPSPSITNQKEKKEEKDANDDKKMGSPMVVAGGDGNKPVSASKKKRNKKRKGGDAKKEKVENDGSNEKEGSSVVDEVDNDDANKPASGKKRNKNKKCKVEDPMTYGVRQIVPHRMPPLPTPPDVRTQKVGGSSGSARYGGKYRRKEDPSEQTSSAQPTKVPAPVAASQTNNKPIVDVAVHRLRHLGHQPSAILRMAATPSHPNSSDYVAMSRENGWVELRSPDEKWRVVGHVHGSQTATVDAMTWICGQTTDTQESQNSITNARGYAASHHVSHAKVQSRRRLYGASRNGTIFQIDFTTGRHRGTMESGGGGVFCLANLCTSTSCGCSSDSGCGGWVAAGCEDGSVRIFRALKTSNSDPSMAAESPCLELVATLPTAGAAVLAIAWGPLNPQGTKKSVGIADTVLYAGIADGTIRRYECVLSPNASIAVDSTSNTSSSSYRQYGWKSTVRMTLPTQSRTTPTRVWCLALLKDLTLVSGDSLGHVHFWDGATGTLEQTFEQNESKADVLDVAVNSQQDKVFASGIDSRIICIERRNAYASKITGTPSAPQAWVLTVARRPHTHDVRSLCIVRQQDPNGSLQSSPNKPPLELICSGGLDTKLCTSLTKDYNKGQFRPRIYYPWPGSVSPIVIMAPQRRILAILRDKCVDLYRLPGNDLDATLALPKPTDGGKHSIPRIAQDETKTHLATIEIKSPFNLICADLSKDGKYLAVSDATCLMLFQLTYEVDGETDAIQAVVTNKIPLKSSSVRKSCSALKFAPDGSGQLICAHPSGSISVLKIAEESNEDVEINVTLEHTFGDMVVDDDNEENVLFPITTLDISSDGRWMSAGRNGVGSGCIHVFSLADYVHWYVVPALEAPHSCVKFLGGGESVEAALAVGCSNLAFYIFDVRHKRLSDWSADSGFPISNSLPTELTHRNDFPLRFAFNPATPNKFLMGSYGAFCAIDLEQPVPVSCQFFPERHVRGERVQPRRPRSESHVTSDEEGTNATGEKSIARRKRKYSHGDDNKRDSNNFTICLRYNAMLFMDFIGTNEMVVVEQPWLSVVANLPDALERKVYGN